MRRPALRDAARALLEERRDDLDGVIVAVPHGRHGPLGLALLAMLVNNTANWQPGFLEAREAVRRGDIGEVRIAQNSYDHVSWQLAKASMFIKALRNRQDTELAAGGSGTARALQMQFRYLSFLRLVATTAAI